jgi:hypothetical protein
MNLIRPNRIRALNQRGEGKAMKGLPSGRKRFPASAGLLIAVGLLIPVAADVRPRGCVVYAPARGAPTGMPVAVV